MIQPRNFMTNPPKKGKVGKMTTFGGPTPFMEDDYNSPKKLAHAELEYHWSKLQDKPFSQKAKKLKNGVFNQPAAIYDVREDIKERSPVVREVNKVEHERAFKPSHDMRITSARFAAKVAPGTRSVFTPMMAKSPLMSSNACIMP